MDMQEANAPMTRPTRRRRRTKLQIFKETYLPPIILAATIVLILVFIIGGAIKHRNPPAEQPQETTTTTQEIGPTEDPRFELWEKEAVQLIIEADALARNYDYDGAIAVLDRFSGDANLFPSLAAAREKYVEIRRNMVAWHASDVPNLSFHLLSADPARAFVNKDYGSSYKKNFITITEFEAILQQLYDNGYVLVSLDHFYGTEFNSTSGRDVFIEKELLLPEGKKPIMITETNTNYYTYMIDSNGDGKADKNAAGFACKLYWDGNFYNELVNADGSISYGAYDLVPILENFIAANPDFSYKGARATIAFSGYDGVLGYRINDKSLSESDLQTEREGAATIVQALRDAGYDLACYTFGNVNYGSKDAAGIKTDIDKWLDQITPWIGELDILVYAKDGEIGDTEMYTGATFNVLYNAGFRYFMGTGQTPWNQVDSLYVRHNRINVTGSNLQKHPDWFAGMFDPITVLDNARP